MVSDLELTYVISYFKGAAQSTVSGAHSALLKNQVKGKEIIKMTLSSRHMASILPTASDTKPYNNPQDEGTLTTIFQMGK